MTDNQDLVQKTKINIPKLPVPSLEATISRYLEALQTILKPDSCLEILETQENGTSSVNQSFKLVNGNVYKSLIDSSINYDEALKLRKQFDETKARAKMFLETEGPLLQQKLQEESLKKENWLTDYYISETHLANPIPVVSNLNPILLFPHQPFLSSNEMLLYATRLIEFAVDFNNRIDNQALTQDYGKGSRKGSPLCMETYKTFFHSCRIPSEQCDIIEMQPKDASYIIVASCNQYYVLFLNKKKQTSDDISAILSTSEIFLQLKDIYEVSRKQTLTTKQVPKLGLLTGGERSLWAKSYLRMTQTSNDDCDFSQLSLEDIQENRLNFKMIHSSLFILCLDSLPDDGEVDDLQVSKKNIDNWLKLRLRNLSTDNFKCLKDKSDAANTVLTGNGSSKFSANRWFDKYMQVIIGRDGICGINQEHSPSETLTTMRFVEEFLTFFNDNNKKTLIEDTKILLGINTSINHKQTSQEKYWKQLTFNLDSNLCKSIDEAKQCVDQLAEDSILKMIEFLNFGANFLKLNRISPHVFVQLALQLAYYRCHGRIASTTAACTLRKFKFGRDGVLRQNALETVAWIQAMQWLKNNQDKNMNMKQECLQTARRMFEIAAQKQIAITQYTTNGESPDNHLMVMRMLALKSCNGNELNLPSLFCDKSYDDYISLKLVTAQMPNECGVSIVFGATYKPNVYGCMYNTKAESIEICFSCARSSNKTNIDKFSDAVVECLLDMQRVCIVECPI